MQNPSNYVEVMVCGLHMRGFPLEKQMLDLNAKYVYTTMTMPNYRMYCIEQGIRKPGLIWDEDDGKSFEVEVWEMEVSKLGSLLMQIPKPLGLGRVVLEGEKEVIGFICEGYCKDKYQDISIYGGWRNFMSQLSVY